MLYQIDLSTPMKTDKPLPPRPQDEAADRARADDRTTQVNSVQITPDSGRRRRPEAAREL